MRALRGFCAVLCLIFMLAGCGSAVSGQPEKISQPEVKSIPFEGKWQIAKYLKKGFGPEKKDAGNPLVGMWAEFSKDFVKVGNDIWYNPSYKVKQVDSDQFFMLRFGLPDPGFGIHDEKIYVTTVTSENKYLYETIKVGEKEAVLIIQDDFFLIEKISDKTDAPGGHDVLTINASPDSSKTASNLNSGILLGIRSTVSAPKKGSSKEAYSYKTLWIASGNRKLHTIMEASDIILPRKTGFWKVEVKSTGDDRKKEDSLVVYSPYDLAAGKAMPAADSRYWEGRYGTINRKIIYAGNDYISTEVTGSGTWEDSNGSWQENRLQIQPLDNISDSFRVKISDLVGGYGLQVLENSRNDAVGTLGNTSGMEILRDRPEENISLTRRTGHWFIKGRLHYKKDKEMLFKDFNLNIIPPAKVVSYDTLYIPWTQVKDRVPEATDVYTSPNNDIALILTSANILVYSIKDGTLEALLDKIKLNEGDSIVMDEWATGGYVEKWEQYFLNQDARKVQ